MAKKSTYYANSSHYDEAIRTLRTNIQFSDIDNQLKKIVVTSSIPDEGKTTVAVNLARSFAQNKFRVLLIDCDLRNPSVHKEMKVDNKVGLTNVLLNKKDLVHSLMKDYGEDYFDILLSGPTPPNPAEILSSKAMRDLIEEVEDQYDYIIIDTPPTGIITDAAIVSTLADGVLLVARSKYTKKEQINQAIENIKNVGSRIIGVVMTFAESSKNTYPDYYK
ncbi:MAG: CpsD/CapB family tyrosine-protein kinase [Anaerococcus sp.]|nr:CpsD/CapB family tyrosine-protein kinase [Anaerococcus sp.]